MYKAEAFLPRCIESILAQDMAELELILVDDASPDRCLEIAREYAARDGRIRVLRADGSGAGVARNVGLDSPPAGAYVGFADADDWVDPSMYRRLLEEARARDADIIFTGMREMASDRVLRRYEWEQQLLSAPAEIAAFRRTMYGPLPWDGKRDNAQASTCTGLYRRSLLERGHVRFPDTHSEDIVFNLRALQGVPRIATIPGAPYCYRKELQESETTRFDSDTTEQYQAALKSMEALIGEEEVKDREECLRRLQARAVYYCLHLASLADASPMGWRETLSYVRSLGAWTIEAMGLDRFPIDRVPMPNRMVFSAVAGRHAAMLLAYVRMRPLAKRLVSFFDASLRA